MHALLCETVFTGENRLDGVNIPMKLCMMFARVTCGMLSKLNGGIHHANMSCLHHSVLTTLHMLHARTSYTILWKYPHRQVGSHR